MPFNFPKTHTLSFAAALGLSLATGPAFAESIHSEENPAKNESLNRGSGEETPSGGFNRDEYPSRKHRRGLGRIRGEFDPKVFEARGRELQGEYYEIALESASPSDAPAWSPAPMDALDASREKPKRSWVFWSGVAGASVLAAGTVGYLLMGDEPAAPATKTVILDDRP